MPVTKIAVIGERQSGKTQLIKALLGKPFDPDYHSTPVFETSSHDKEQLQFFDISSLVNSAEKIYKDTDILLYCIDAGKQNVDMQKIKEDIAQFERYCPTAVRLMVITKSELDSSPLPQTDQTKTKIYETSAAQSIGIEELKSKLITLAQEQKAKQIILAQARKYEEAKAKLLARVASNPALEKSIKFELANLESVLSNPQISLESKSLKVADFVKRCESLLKGDQVAVGLVLAVAALALTVFAAFTGFMLGFAAGVWTGPGAFITGLIAGQTAAVVFASCIGIQATATGLGAFGLFKDITAIEPGLKKQVTEVADAAQIHYDLAPAQA